MEDDPDMQPDRVAMRGELRRLMEACIDRLPDAFRSVFILRAIEEMSVEDVATALDLPEATVRTRLFRARGLLRERTVARHRRGNGRCLRVRRRTLRSHRGARAAKRGTLDAATPKANSLDVGARGAAAGTPQQRRAI